jgi:hypothetical protein
VFSSFLMHSMFFRKVYQAIWVNKPLAAICCLFLMAASVAVVIVMGLIPIYLPYKAVAIIAKNNSKFHVFFCMSVLYYFLFLQQLISIWRTRPTFLTPAI